MLIENLAAIRSVYISNVEGFFLIEANLLACGQRSTSNALDKHT